ncbi:PorT family protein [Chitinophaga silvatica]|uniref:PorT family protein n=1 Tax=Chitinophaga silvatica TaxID=2282649 RepID=A0A3E1YBW5_9BACT|nr:porin family protein [Chitinophaga silvatica]RFS23294.1 PorT family protein [Chitinophaga silvatica]
MKIFTLFCATILVATTAHGQASLGVRSGYLNTDFVSSVSNPNLRTSPSHNWMVGPYVNIPLGWNFHIQTGLNYSVKGAQLNFGKVHPEATFATDVTEIKLKYLELPVHLLYKINTGIGKVVLGGGPYGAYCVRGDYSLSIYNNGTQVQTNNQHINFRSTPTLMGTDVDLQRWDAGVEGSIGMEFNCFITLSLNYAQGLMDIDKGSSKLQNQYLGVKIGILFNREDW